MFYANSASGGDALRGLLHCGKRAVPLRYIELDPAGAFDPRTAYLGTMVLEALGHHDLNTVRRAGHRITDRLVFGLEYSRDRYLGAAARQIEIEPDRRKDRVEHLCHDQTENVEYRAFGRILPGQYAEQCLALRRRRPFVDDRLKGSVALMQRSGKIDGGAELRPLSRTSPKCPSVMCMPTNPLQLPFVGRALKSQGQPKAQLQFLIQSPLRRHSVRGI